MRVSRPLEIVFGIVIICILAPYVLLGANVALVTCCGPTQGSPSFYDLMDGTTNYVAYIVTRGADCFPDHPPARRAFLLYSGHALQFATAAAAIAFLVLSVRRRFLGRLIALAMRVAATRRT